MAYSLASRKEFILCINIEPITVFIRYPSWQEFAQTKDYIWYIFLTRKMTDLYYPQPLLVSQEY